MRMLCFFKPLHYPHTDEYRWADALLFSEDSDFFQRLRVKTYSNPF
jgi:hypothetical protein